MKKNCILFLSFCFCLLLSQNSTAQIKNITNAKKIEDKITVTGYLDYPPFGFIETIRPNPKGSTYNIFRSVFDDVISDLKNKSNIEFSYIYNSKLNDENIIKGLNAGKYDLFLGMYHNTKRFERLQPAFPALLDNPVSLITMPDTAQKIKNLSQLKNLKGAACSKEYFTDFVINQMKMYNIKFVDDPLTMFELLYTGEIDYIFASQYFGIIEAAKIGLRDRFSFSKQIIWNMPMFIGVSKLSPSRKFLIEKLSSYASNPDHKAKIQQKLRQIIHDFEIKYRGVVPPPFVKKETTDKTTSSLDLSEQKDKL